LKNKIALQILKTAIAVEPASNRVCPEMNACDFSHQNIKLPCINLRLFAEIIEEKIINMASKKEETVFLKDLHFEHRLYLNELKFYKEELEIFEHRLDELVKKYTTKKVLARLEQFQNKFIHQKEVIHDLKHRIKAHEKQLAYFAENHSIAVDHQHFKDHAALREEMIDYRKIFSELKESFLRYLAEWM